MKKRNIKTTRGFLRAVRELIEAGWTKGYMARDKHSRETAVGADNAARFCLIGAIARVEMESGIYSTPFYDEARDAVARAIGSQKIVTFNDSTTTKKSDVLAVLDRAIKAS